jgi:hypothetical protein
VHASTTAVRLLLTEENDVETLLIVLLVLFVLGGGGWGILSLARLTPSGEEQSLGIRSSTLATERQEAKPC